MPPRTWDTLFCGCATRGYLRFYLEVVQSLKLVFQSFSKSQSSNRTHLRAKSLFLATKVWKSPTKCNFQATFYNFSDFCFFYKKSAQNTNFNWFNKWKQNRSVFTKGLCYSAIVHHYNREQASVTTTIFNNHHKNCNNYSEPKVLENTATKNMSLQTFISDMLVY